MRSSFPLGSSVDVGVRKHYSLNKCPLLAVSGRWLSTVTRSISGNTVLWLTPLRADLG